MSQYAKASAFGGGGGGGGMSNPMTTAADLIYGGASGTPTRLANGTVGQVLTSSGTTVAPTWATPASGGDVIGPASATNNALARYDLATGKLIQTSVGILSDAGVLTGLTGLTSSGTITVSTVTASRALTTNGSSQLAASATTATELGYVNGVTSAIQTQLNAARPMTTGGDVMYGGASGLPTRLANGSAGQVLQSNGGTAAPSWAAAASAIGFATESVTTNITAVSTKTYLVTTSSARTITLPAAANNAYFKVKDVTGTAGTNNITIARAASEQIEGVAASKILQTNWGAWTFVSNGTNWFMV